MLKDRTIVLTVLTLLLLVSVPYMVAAETVPPDRIFPGAFHDPLDTPVYLSAMRAGARGDWLRTLPFTDESHAAALYYPFYILLGHIAPPNVITFHIARLFIVLLLVLAVWRVISEIVPDPAELRIAFMFAMLGMGVGWVVLLAGFARVIRPTDLFAPTSTLFGASFINPHFPLAAALEMLCVFEYLRARRQPIHKGRLTAGALACFAMGWVVPYSLVVLGLILLVDTAIEAAVQRKVWTEAARAAFCILFPSSLTILYYFWLTRLEPFWSKLVAQWPELDHTFTPPEYLAGYGFSLLFALAGAVMLWRQPSRSAGERLLLVWLIVNALLIVSPLDFSDRTSLGFSVPLAILSAIALVRIVRARQPRLNGVLPRLIFASLLPAPMLLMFSHVLTIQNATDVPDVLPRNDALVIQWLDAHAGPQDVVLAAPTLSNQIPALSNARVYSGHQFETFEPARKNREITTFFDAATSNDERRAFLAAHPITYVYAAPNLRHVGAYDGTATPFLEPMIQSGNVTLYRVNLNGR